MPWRAVLSSRRSGSGRGLTAGASRTSCAFSTRVFHAVRSPRRETTQVGAIPPDVLVQIVTDAITDLLDGAPLAAVLARETRIRAQPADTLDQLLNNNGGDAQ
jgi:hypothetical protein